MSIWALLGTGSPWDAVLAYALATPGTEPLMPAWVVEISRVVHCSLHSAVLAGLISLLSGPAEISNCDICCSGWWSHILIDTFTHSAAYYPLRTFYPLSEWSFDGLGVEFPRVHCYQLSAAGSRLSRDRSFKAASVGIAGKAGKRYRVMLCRFCSIPF